MVLEAHEVALCLQHGSIQALDLRIFDGGCHGQADAVKESEKTRPVGSEGTRESRER
jgi:hypothetical protein